MQTFMETYMKCKKDKEAKVSAKQTPDNEEKTIIIQHNIVFNKPEDDSMKEEDTRSSESNKENFATPLRQNDLKENLSLSKVTKFRFTPKAPLSHNSDKKANQSKITWRSPLTYSPPVKFSPKINYSHLNPSEGSSSGAGFSKSVSSSFPLSDKAHHKVPLDSGDRNDEVLEKVGDLASTTFLEECGLIAKRKNSIKTPNEYYHHLMKRPKKESKEDSSLKTKLNKSYTEKTKVGPNESRYFGGTYLKPEDVDLHPKMTDNDNTTKMSIEDEMFDDSMDSVLNAYLPEEENDYCRGASGSRRNYEDLERPQCIPRNDFDDDFRGAHSVSRRSSLTFHDENARGPMSSAFRYRPNSFSYDDYEASTSAYRQNDWNYNDSDDNLRGQLMSVSRRYSSTETVGYDDNVQKIPSHSVPRRNSLSYSDFEDNVARPSAGTKRNSISFNNNLEGPMLSGDDFKEPVPVYKRNSDGLPQLNKGAFSRPSRSAYDFEEKFNKPVHDKSGAHPVSTSNIFVHKDSQSNVSKQNKLICKNLEELNKNARPRPSNSTVTTYDLHTGFDENLNEANHVRKPIQGVNQPNYEAWNYPQNVPRHHFTRADLNLNEEYHFPSEGHHFPRAEYNPSEGHYFPRPDMNPNQDIPRQLRYKAKNLGPFYEPYVYHEDALYMGAQNSPYMSNPNRAIFRGCFHSNPEDYNESYCYLRRMMERPDNDPFMTDDAPFSPNMTSLEHPERTNAPPRFADPEYDRMYREPAYATFVNPALSSPTRTRAGKYPSGDKNYVMRRFLMDRDDDPETYFR